MSTFAICAASCAKAASRISFTPYEGSAISSRNRNMRRIFLRGAGSFPIRTQMMLWYTLVFAILICLFSAVFYINLKTSLQTNIDSDIHEQALEIADGIRDNHGA